MKGSTKLWLSVYIVLMPISWHGQLYLVSANPELFTCLNVVSGVITFFFFELKYKPNVHALWGVLIAPLGIIAVLVFMLIWKWLGKTFMAVVQFFTYINSLADKHLGI